MKKTKEENEDNRTMFLGQLGGGLIIAFIVGLANPAIGFMCFLVMLLAISVTPY